MTDAQTADARAVSTAVLRDLAELAPSKARNDPASRLVCSTAELLGVVEYHVGAALAAAREREIEAKLARAEEARDEGADSVLLSLTGALGVQSHEGGDGETFEEAVDQEVFNILVEAGVLCAETSARLAHPKGIVDQLAAAERALRDAGWEIVALRALLGMNPHHTARPKEPPHAD